MSERERMAMPKVPTEEEKAMEKVRMRLNVVALSILFVSLILFVYAPKINSMGFSYSWLMMIAYGCTLVSAGFMLYSLKYTQEDRKTGTRVTGILMLFVGGFGFLYTLLPMLQLIK